MPPPHPITECLDKLHDPRVSFAHDPGARGLPGRGRRLSLIDALVARDAEHADTHVVFVLSARD